MPFWNESQMSVQPIGDNTASWLRPIRAGTADALFIESNKFVWNAAANFDDQTSQEPITHAQGSRTVIRYNSFDTSAYPNEGFMMEEHGNGNCFSDSTNDIRGQPIIEMYNNVVHVAKTYRFIHLRGGSMIVLLKTVASRSGKQPGPPSTGASASGIPSTRCRRS